MKCPECNTELTTLTNNGHCTVMACNGCGLKWTRELLRPARTFEMNETHTLAELVATAHAHGATSIQKIAPGEGIITVEIGVGIR